MKKQTKNLEIMKYYAKDQICKGELEIVDCKEEKTKFITEKTITAKAPSKEIVLDIGDVLVFITERGVKVMEIGRKKVETLNIIYKDE
jgi:hypothetical protein